MLQRLTITDNMDEKPFLVKMKYAAYFWKPMPSFNIGESMVRTG